MDIPALLEKIRTPNKTGRFLIGPSGKPGAFDSHAVDCPFPFSHEGEFWMSFIGFDGRGYQTGLARSADLLEWKKQGLWIGRGPEGSVTEHNVALTCILRDPAIDGPGTLRKVNGRYLGTYHAYPGVGYEAGSAVIGLCWSDDLNSWQIDPPVLEADPACEWEAGGLYKSWLVENDGTYYLFYNAKNHTGGPWVEQTGFASSRDLVHWERCPANPVLPVGPEGDPDDRFASDPTIFRLDDAWVLFYFGLCSDGHARDLAAFSEDLRTWRKGGEVLIDVGPEGAIDSRYAHKPGIISRDGKLYHYYCAVSPSKDGRVGEIEHGDDRGISLATS